MTQPDVITLATQAYETARILLTRNNEKDILDHITKLTTEAQAGSMEAGMALPIFKLVADEFDKKA